MKWFSRFNTVSALKCFHQQSINRQWTTENPLGKEHHAERAKLTDWKLNYVEQINFKDFLGFFLTNSFIGFPKFLFIIPPALALVIAGAKNRK